MATVGDSREEGRWPGVGELGRHPACLAKRECNKHASCKGAVIPAALAWVVVARGWVGVGMAAEGWAAVVLGAAGLETAAAATVAADCRHGQRSAASVLLCTLPKPSLLALDDSTVHSLAQVALQATHAVALRLPVAARHAEVVDRPILVRQRLAHQVARIHIDGVAGVAHVVLVREGQEDLRAAAQTSMGCPGCREQDGQIGSKQTGWRGWAGLRAQVAIEGPHEECHEIFFMVRAAAPPVPARNAETHRLGSQKGTWLSRADLVNPGVAVQGAQLEEEVPQGCRPRGA